MDKVEWFGVTNRKCPVHTNCVRSEKKHHAPYLGQYTVDRRELHQEARQDVENLAKTGIRSN